MLTALARLLPQAALVLVTSHLGFTGLLEKRVRSRLSQRMVLVTAPPLASSELSRERLGPGYEKALAARGAVQWSATEAQAAPGHPAPAPRAALVRAAPWALAREMLLQAVRARRKFGGLATGGDFFY